MMEQIIELHATITTNTIDKRGTEITALFEVAMARLGIPPASYSESPALAKLGERQTSTTVGQPLPPVTCLRAFHLGARTWPSLGLRG